jgi:hypothetical protein
MIESPTTGAVFTMFTMATPSRTPPIAVRRKLRQEVGFACPVPDCGSPYLTWHHFDPPWHVTPQHEPAGMIALCKSAPGAVTENITDSCKSSRLTNSRRRVSRAQIGANSGHVREEQRFTSSGIGRSQLQRWNRRPRRVADAIAARAPASLVALIVPPCLVAVLQRSPAGDPTRPACPESVQPQSQNQSRRVISVAPPCQPEGPARAAKSWPRLRLVD